MEEDKSKEEPTRNLPEISPNHLAYAVIRSQGFNNADTSKMLKFTPGNGCHIDKKINGKYDLTNIKFVKLASNVIKEVLKGSPTVVSKETVLDDKGEVKELVKEVYPKHSERLQASQMVYDRYQPIKRGDDRPTSISFIQINVESMK